MRPIILALLILTSSPNLASECAALLTSSNPHNSDTRVTQLFTGEFLFENQRLGYSFHLVKDNKDWHLINNGGKLLINVEEILKDVHAAGFELVVFPNIQLEDY